MIVRCTLDGRVPALALALVPALVAGACEPSTSAPATSILPQTYINVMGELADLQRFPLPGSGAEEREARADSARRAILERYGVTADELLQFADEMGATPEAMVEIAAGIVEVSDSLAALRREAEPADSVLPGASNEDDAAPDRAGAEAGVGLGADAAGGAGAETEAESRPETPAERMRRGPRERIAP